jgi:hypothetical protein
MALTITTKLTTIDVANNNLIYSLTSNTSSSPQYKMVCDIYESGSSTLIQRLKQQPNLSGVGVFDLGQVIQSHIGELLSPSPDVNNYFNIASATATGIGNVINRYVVRFGEEWGTSTSSSVVLYNGTTNAVGAPAASGSVHDTIFNGLAEPNNKVSTWQWDYRTKWFPTTATPYSSSLSPQFTRQICLTDMPRTASLREGEPIGLSWLQGNDDSTYVTTGQAQDVFGVRAQFYDSNNTLLSTQDIINSTVTAGGPRATTIAQWSTAATQTNYRAAGGEQYQLLTLNAGDVGTGFGALYPANWSYVNITLHPQDKAGFFINYSSSYDSFRLQKAEAQCGYGGVRFAWKNIYGVWDYYTFDLANDKTNTITRESFQQSFVPYGTTTAAVNYSKARRGTKQFYNQAVQSQTANTDWLNDSKANWLKELFFSANVYIYDSTNSVWLPVIITSAEVVEKTNPRTQTMFQYLIIFEPANQYNPRL